VSTNKILCTTTSYPPAVGGAQLHTHEIIKRLLTYHSVQVITHWAENRTDWLLGTTLKAPTEPKSYTFENIPVELITLTTHERWELWPYVFGYYVIKPLAINQIAAVLAPKLEPFARDCVLVHNTRIGREPLSSASLKVAHKLNIPFVFVPYHHPRWIGWNYREYLSLYRQADALIALTHVEKQTLIDLGVAEARIFVTGMGPVLAAQANPEGFRQELNLAEDIPLILFLGQKYQYKGFEALVAAAKIVWQTWPEALFLFIGPRTSFSTKFFSQHHDPRLIEWGAVDLQKKTDALAACTLLCLPSTQESFGGVFTEAWSFGKPVIGADIPAIREVINDELNGYLVSSQAEEIAEKICHLLENPTIAEKLGRAGREKTLQYYSWDKLAQKTEEIYTTVLTGRNKSEFTSSRLT
jgi:glycosyltransferase involved in cell wall biosynthesis